MLGSSTSSRRNPGGDSTSGANGGGINYNRAEDWNRRPVEAEERRRPRRSTPSHSPDPPGGDYHSMMLDRDDSDLRTTPRSSSRARPSRGTSTNNTSSPPTSPSRQRQQQQQRHLYQQHQSNPPSRSSRICNNSTTGNNSNDNIGTRSSLSTPLQSTAVTTLSSTTNNATATAPSINYRGFSTSIGDMFAHPHQERVDCCAMTCCGIFQSDRDRYLLQGVTPPSPWKRVWVHFALPILLFLMAGWVSIHVYDVVWNEILCLVFLLLLLGSVMIQCQKGRVKRMEIRKDVLWYRYQLLQHQHDNLSLDQILETPRDPNEDYFYRGQTERDIGCSHPCCFLIGCYPTDRPGPAALLECTGSDANQVEASMCSCLYRTFCSPICGMHLQLFGICGMAQESREIESGLLPPAYRRLDYVTMEPFVTFFEEIYNQRWVLFNTNFGVGPEGPRAVGPFDEWKLPHLSRLSKLILQGWVALTIFLGIWSVVGPLFWTHFLQGQGRRHFFYYSDYIVYMSSWLVCFGTLAIVVHFCQKHGPLELSIDAMIKYFACGFVLSTTLAIFYELALGLVLELGMLVFMAFSGIDIVKDNNYNMWMQRPLSMGFSGGANGMAHGITSAAAADGGNYWLRFGRDHPVIYSIYLFINSYFLAAMVEEICKYFGFRMMEHPDLLSQRDVEDAARAGVVEDSAEDSSDDGRHAVSSVSNRRIAAGPGSNGIIVQQPAVERRQRRRHFPRHCQSLQAQGSAITVAMVCVALGFSVCEDLIYIFLYNGSSVETEIYVMVARTLFPIHPIATALQSIGVCERDVEKCPTRFGRILLPAVVFHGTYDFLLVWMDFLASLKRSDGYKENDDEALEVPVHAVILSYLISAIVMAAALTWYYKKSKQQRERLALRDADPSE